MHWMILLAIAVTSDAIDYLGVGMIPGAGDLLDVLTVGLLFPFVGMESSIGLVELVPGADILPTYTVLAVWTIWQAYEEHGTLNDLDISRKL